MKERIIGYDFARGLAVIGMIFINFSVVMMKEESGLLFEITEFCLGKAAALFVILAGIGMTLMYDRVVLENDRLKVKLFKMRMYKRALFLFILGQSYYFIWPADILHFYGAYLIIGTLFIFLKRKACLIVSLTLIITYSLLIGFIDYESGWNWETLKYSGFFTINGYLRNLFVNGFHPVFPWVAFIFWGFWIGRLNLQNKTIRKKTTIISLIVFLFTKGFSMFLIDYISKMVPTEAVEIKYLLGTNPMPPLFFYMINSASLAVFIICISIYIGNRFSKTMVFKQIVSTGQLALSIYVFHVIIGMLALQLIFGKLERSFSSQFVFAYSVFFNFTIVVLSSFWKSKFSKGPLEYVMRKITD